ncbi:MAG: tRNA 2-thiouridine(34) synthase MnmA [Firmicutes bacterium]|nr:tRNA 2-thiouridine(34) synthase MnmA [Bacillota bacterium]
MLEQYGIKKLYDENSGPMVVVGLSGGVDSSVSAYILKWQGYRVIGLFMRNWEEKDGDGFCTSEADFTDAKRVAEQIGIPYYSVNFSKQYMDNVFAQFLRGLGAGFTPNPDILCNREIKFGPFLDYANKIGAEYIATGHYCRVQNGQLMRGLDETKDQSYFLCGLSREQLSRVIFPVGGLKKTAVREIAEQLGLSTAKKKDSTGICFIGERKFRDFLKTYFGNQPGVIKTLDGVTVGTHTGLMYYTIGQRKGLGIGGRSTSAGGKSCDNTSSVDMRWFVVAKDIPNNTLIVNNGECDELFTNQLTAIDFNFMAELPKTCTAKTRYRQPDQECIVTTDGKDVIVKFKNPQRAVTPGQWVVLYNGDMCLGGGQIKETSR